MHECGCEKGMDCTRTTVCAIDSAVSDAQDLVNQAGEIMMEAVFFLQRKQAGQSMNEVAARMHTWIGEADG